MPDFKTEIVAFISKAWIYIAFGCIGLVAKFSFDYKKGRKITWIQAISITGCALFVGYLATVWCMNNAPDKAPYIVPIATFSSDKIITVITNLPWKEIIHKIFNINTNSENKQD